ncbi:hypothetical protein Leryth_019294 [Lithospermum erythrorhizon]|nr:hypothetical protein Leryth_019294 [Lithospermum erythrorhizon]
MKRYNKITFFDKPFIKHIILYNYYRLCTLASSSGVVEDKDLLKKTPNGKLQVLELIDEGRLYPNGSLYNKLIKMCTQLKRLPEGKMVHTHFLNSRFSHYVVPYNTLISFYGSCECVEDAREVFDGMPDRDMVSWTALITCYAQNERFVEGMVAFREMLKGGFVANEFTLGSVLKAAAGIGGRGEEGKEVHGVCVKSGYEGDVYVGSALVDMYARSGCMNEARNVFDGLECKNGVSWNALIAGHARKGEEDSSIKLFMEMRRGGFMPTHFTYSSIFAACASSGALEQGKWVHVHLIKSGLLLIAFIGNTLLDMYGKAGSIEDARKVFDRLVKRDVISWNSMLTACAQHGLGQETVNGFEEMRRKGFEPNQVTFLCVLTACSHAGLLDKGLHYFELMKKYNIDPGISHYVTMVDLLGRAGRLDHAHCFIQQMPIEPSAAIWKALLGACRMHKKMELGAYAAERVFKLDPHDSGPHILLSNMYASEGRLKDAARVRKMMNDSGVKKEPACSWVDIENVVHMFVSNDDSHPQIGEIRRLWGEITEKIKNMGYVPDKSHVLWFSNEQEREERLQYHSERLALAFSLLNTPSRSPVRIKKNIRICGDCHTVFKFTSTVVKREIIIRDTNRFHHFRDGACSCGDYW